MEVIPGCKTTKTHLKPGSGTGIVQRGNTCTVHATGVVKATGKKFWSSKDPGQTPFTFRAGAGDVIKGWDQGCLGMSEGEVSPRGAYLLVQPWSSLLNVWKSAEDLMRTS
mmetsp:Transcript_7304/g.13069  ORF Transcript_7304/g.13069 Transcript_7304/m.13069 type:complete len:110 (+) Transcript_7304:37-366(+)